MDYGGDRRRRRMASAFDADAQALFARMSVQPTPARKALINEFIVGIKSDLSINNLSDAFDYLRFVAGSNQADSRLNWVKAAHTATEANTPTWTLDRGYTGNAIDMYLNENYNPSTEGVNYSRNNASFGFYSRTNAASTHIEIGNHDGTSGSLLQPRSGAGNLGGRVNSALFAGTAVADSLGMFSGARLNDAANFKTYKNGALVETKAAASVALINFDFFLLAFNNSGSASNFTARQVAFSFVGSGTLINQAQLYARVQTYLTGLGAQV